MNVVGRDDDRTTNCTDVSHPSGAIWEHTGEMTD